MTRATRFGITWIEWIVIVTIAVVLIALMWPGFVGVADGDFQLVLKFEGVTQPGDKMRLAIGWGQDPSHYLAAEPEIPPSWHDVSAWDGPYSINSHYSYQLKTDWLGRIKPGPAVFQRMAFIEYTAPNEPAIYRVIPFERRHGQELVELTIPRKHPTDAEAWQPNEPIESASR